MIIIGVHGKANAGKDTAVNAMCDSGDEHHSFARPIKDAVCDIFGCRPEQLEDRESKEQLIPGFDFTYRYAMQTLGTEWGRHLDRNLWLKLVDYKASTFHTRNFDPDRNNLFLISDVRFENEAAWVVENPHAPGYVLQIVRPDSDIKESGHASEAGIPEHLISHTIQNNGSREQLIAQVLHWREEILKKHNTKRLI